MALPTMIRSHVDDLMDEWWGTPPDPTTDDEADEEEEASPLLRLEDNQSASWVRRWQSARPHPGRSARPVRILMLHDYAASGWRFAEETRGLSRRLQRDLPDGVELHYPNAHYEVPCRPRWRRSAFLAADTTFRGWSPVDGAADSDDQTKHSLRKLILYTHRRGPFDGILGFGQGATIGALLATCCEVFARDPEQACHGLGMAPISENICTFKFFISVAGCRLIGSAYDNLYESKTTTASLHLVPEMGPLDLVSQMDALPFCFERAEVVQYYRWHDWPNIKDNRTKLSAFILKQTTGGEPPDTQDHVPVLDALVEFADPFA